MLGGTSTVRAFKQENRFIENMDTVPGVYQLIGGQWLAIRLDFLGAIIILFVGVLAMTTRNYNFINAGELGLGLSYAIQMTALLKMVVKVNTTLEAQMNAVERFNFYINSLQPERNRSSQDMEDCDAASVITDSDTVVTDSDTVANTNEIELQETSVPGMVLPPSTWPQQGRIEYANVSMRYRDGPLVLNNVSFVVNAHENVGLCGRTGYVDKDV